ncbi:MAG: twin-arginine translocase TatA/TatE family subunit [Actinomycetota bacterium]
MNLGPGEIMVIALAALLIFGPRRLPEIARTAGRAVQEFRRATRDLTSDLRMEIDETPDLESTWRRPEISRRLESFQRPEDTPPSPPPEEPRPGPRA